MLAQLSAVTVIGLDNDYLGAEWEKFAAYSRKTMVTARDIFLGHYSYDQASILKTGMTSVFWSEIHDVMLETDNGKIGLVFCNNTLWVEQNTIVFLDNCHRVECPYGGNVSQLTVVYLPNEVKIKAGLTEIIIPVSRGQLLVVQNPDCRSSLRAFVVWRPDGRFAIGTVVSGHSDVRWAKDSLDKMKRDFKPPVIKARSKASGYDRQRYMNGKTLRYRNTSI